MKTAAWVIAAAFSAALVEVGLSLAFCQGFDGLENVFALGSHVIAERGFALLASCVETGVVEEVLFRGALLFLLVKLLSGSRCSFPSASVALAAAAISSVVFGAAHILGIDLLDFGLQPALSAVLKCVQGTLFGLCMAAVTLTRRDILFPIAIHTAFDFIYFAPGYLVTGSLPSDYLMASAVEAIPVLVTILLFLPPAFAGVRALRGHVLGFFPTKTTQGQ